MDKENELFTILDRPCFKVYSRIIYRTIEAQNKNPRKLFTEAGLDVDCLWEDDENDNWWVYSDWFRALRLGYRVCGPQLPVMLTEGIHTSSLPLMEEIVASSPNFATTLDMWESWQQELEPLFSMQQRKRAGKHIVIVDYMVRGKILEAFSLSCAAIICGMVWSHLGRNADYSITTSFPDSHGTFQNWSDMWQVPLHYMPGQKESLVFEFHYEDMKTRNVGFHRRRFAAARERYMGIVSSVVDFTQRPSLIDFAAAVMKTSRKQFTRQSIASEINVSETEYSSALADKGWTHKAFIDFVQMQRVKEMQSLGYDDAKLCKSMGIQDQRKLQRLISRVSPRQITR